ncbi:MAG: hypothetical protein EOP11_16635 [Proteobacteria bacterium]|nr:MAG: hypothetical protein EOP11_16635 [Pseudomonadota bacterium]
MFKYTLGILASLLVAGAAHAAAWYGDQAYLACNPDVAQALRNGQITSAYDHYIQFGQFENRVFDGSCVSGQRPGRPGQPDYGRPGRPGRPDEGRPGRPGRPDGRFDEREYLRCNPDVAQAVRRGQVRSGWEHYQQFGRRENRRLSCR